MRHKARVQDHAVGHAVVVAASAIADEEADGVGQAVAVAVAEDRAGARDGIPGEGPDGLRRRTQLEVGVVLTFCQAQVNAMDLAHILVDHLRGQQIDLALIDQARADDLRVEAEFQHIGHVGHGLCAAQRSAEQLTRGGRPVLDAVDLDFDLEVTALVEARIVQQRAESGRLNGGIDRHVLATRHLQGCHIALVGIVDAVGVQIGEDFFFGEEDAIAVQFLQVALVLRRHDPDGGRRAGHGNVARAVFVAVLHIPVAFGQRGQRHDGVGGSVVEAWDDPAIDHQRHACRTWRWSHREADHAAGRWVGANQLRGLCGSRRGCGDQLVSLFQAIPQNVAIAHDLQLNRLARTGFQLRVGPIQRGALHHARQVNPAGAARGRNHTVQTPVQSVVAAQWGAQAGVERLQGLAGDEVVGQHARVTGQLQTRDAGQPVHDGVDQGLQIAGLGDGAAIVGRGRDAGFQGIQLAGAHARCVQTQSLQIGQAQGLGVACSGSHDPLHCGGQGFNLADRVDFVGAEVADAAVQQLQAFNRQVGGSACTHGAVGGGRGVLARCQVGQGAIGFGQDEVVGVDDGLNFRTAVGQRAGDRGRGQCALHGGQVLAVDPRDARKAEVRRGGQGAGVVFGVLGDDAQRVLLSGGLQQGAQFSQGVRICCCHARGLQHGRENLQLATGHTGDAQCLHVLQGQAGRRGLVIGQGHDLADRVGQGFDFRDRVHRIKRQVSDHVVQKCQAQCVQCARAGGPDVQVVLRSRVLGGRGIGGEAVGFGQDGAERINHRLRFGHGVHRGARDRCRGQRAVDREDVDAVHT